MLDMRSKLTGDFESIAVGMMMTPVEYDAYLINKAIQVSDHNKHGQLHLRVRQYSDFAEGQ